MVVGIHRNDPSSSGGMNSLPSPGNTWLPPTHSVVGVDPLALDADGLGGGRQPAHHPSGSPAR